MQEACDWDVPMKVEAGNDQTELENTTTKNTREIPMMTITQLTDLQKVWKFDQERTAEEGKMKG